MYLHAVIDNCFRRILSWTLEEQLGGGGPCRILCEAAVQLNDCLEHTIVVAGSGRENVNGVVDDLALTQETEIARVLIRLTFCTLRVRLVLASHNIKL